MEYIELRLIAPIIVICICIIWWIKVNCSGVCEAYKKTKNGDIRICEQGGKFIIEIYEGTEYYSYKYCGTLEEAKEAAKLLQKKYHYL